MPSPDFDTLQIGGIVISAKGGKTAPITQGDCGWAHWDPKETLQVVMEPGAYQDAAATRVNLMLRPNAAQQAELEELDKWVLAYAAKNSERFFGKTLSAAQVKDRYLPCLKASDKYPPTVRVKMNLEGIGKTRFWTQDGEETAAPKSWAGCTVQAIIRLKALWLMPSQFGIILELTDAHVYEPQRVCPFK